MRYGPVRVYLTALFRPVAALRRGDHLPLWKAWVVHAVGVALTPIVVTALIVWDEIEGRTHLASYLAELILECEAITEALREPGTWTTIALNFAGIELFWGASAVLVMSWSAKDERVRDSYDRSLRRLYLLTPHAATITLVSGAAFVWLDRWVRYNRFDGGWPDPFMVQTILTAVTFGAACLWSLRVVLAGLGFDKGVAMSRWPARCRVCGYELAGIKRGRDCPECGEMVEFSTDRATRPGNGPPGGVLWWLAQTYQAVRRPSELGGRLHVLSPDPAYKRCLVFTFAWMMLCSPFAVACLYLLSTLAESMSGPSQPFNVREFVTAVCVGGIMLGLALTAAVAFSAVAGAGLVGVLEGRRNGRNLMPAAIRAACYLCGFACFWAVVFWCNLAVIIVTIQLKMLAPISLRYHIPLNDLVFGWVGGVVILGVLIYLGLIGRATRAARFANW
jgi:hypothetical protein